MTWIYNIIEYICLSLVRCLNILTKTQNRQQFVEIIANLRERHITEKKDPFTTVTPTASLYIMLKSKYQQ